jgi:hypothetical protein
MMSVAELLILRRREWRRVLTTVSKDAIKQEKEVNPLIFDDTGRATRKEIQAEIEARMRLLKMRERLIQKQREQIV